MLFLKTLFNIVEEQFFFFFYFMEKISTMVNLSHSGNLSIFTLLEF